MKLAQFTNQIYSCLRCGFCFDHAVGGQEKICPSYVTYGMESYGARGKMAIARALVDGALGYDAEVRDRVYACTECGACEAQCFKYLSLLDIYRAMKEDLAERTLIPSGLAAAQRSTASFGNPYERAPEKRLQWAPGTERVGKAARTVLFVGCTPSYVRRGIARGAYDVLDAAGVDFALLAEETCCGHPDLTSGDVAAAKEAVARNVAQIEAAGATDVVFACPGCLRMFRETAAELLERPLPFRCLHVTERLAACDLRLRRQARLVAYHDPCHLGRGLGVYDAPRAVIDAVPGARRVEIRRAGAGSYCCGNGSFVRLDCESMAVENEQARWDEVAATGADLVLSACPACQIAFLDARRRAKSSLEVLDVVEWLATAV